MKSIFIVLMVLILTPSIALGSTTKVLEQDTELHPQGWPSGSIVFKSGSTVEFNDRGEVISGVLKSVSTLRPKGTAFVSPVYGAALPDYVWYIKYQSESFITFDETGYVLSGTPKYDTDAYLISNVEPMIRLKGNNVVAFDKYRNLVRGTLRDSTFLRPVGWEKYLSANAGFVKFMAASEVFLGPNAQVLKGTIANDLTINGRIYPAGTTLQFSEVAPPRKS